MVALQSFSVMGEVHFIPSPHNVKAISSKFNLLTFADSEHTISLSNDNHISWPAKKVFLDLLIGLQNTIS